jgi:hypothetical protein
VKKRIKIAINEIAGNEKLEIISRKIIIFKMISLRACVLNLTPFDALLMILSYYLAKGSIYCYSTRAEEMRDGFDVEEEKKKKLFTTRFCYNLR